MANEGVAAGGGRADSDALSAQVESLQEALALERAKNEVLLEQCLKTEDALADKDVEGFADVIPNDDREFWRGQLLDNREAAVGILNRMRERAKPADGKPAAAPAPSAGSGQAPQPLHNRAAAPRPGSGQASPAATPGDRAAKLRNRAQEIARRDGCSFTAAFRAAEQEFGEVR